MRTLILITAMSMVAPSAAEAQRGDQPHDTVYIASVDADSVTLVVAVSEGITATAIHLGETPGILGPEACELPIPVGVSTPVTLRCPRSFVDRAVYVRTQDRPLGKVTIPAQTEAGRASVPVAREPSEEATATEMVELPPKPAEPRSRAAAASGDPELPRGEPILPGTYSNRIRVPAGGNLQRAIDRARPGDEILLASGARYEGQFQLPDRGDDGWVRIATELDVPEGVRIDTTAALATLTAPGGNWTIAARGGGGGWELSLLEITHDANHVNAPVYLHGGERIPDRVLLDRVWIHPAARGTATRAVLGNATNLTVRYSALTGIVRPGQQTQGVAQWNSGVTLIHDNLIMAASQGYLCGGANGVFQHPNDITIRRNHFLAPPEWEGRYASLAQVETKDCHRLLVEGNVIDGGNFGFLLKSSAQGGACGEGCGSQHLTIRNNRVRNTKGGANLGRLTGAGGFPMHDVLFDNNLFEDIGPDAPGWRGEGRLFQVLGAPINLTLRNMTFDTRGHSWIYLVSGPSTPSPGLTIDNIVATGPLRYGALVQAPPRVDRHYRTRDLGTSYGSCRGRISGLTCISAVSSWAGADRAAIAQATRGVVR